MSDISLRTYVQQLDNLIERKNVDEAIAHSRHILSFYPKHLDTYRMLGKALLEKGRHGDAADVFQRVLSVLPDDFISHVGMAIVREDEANLEAALWHMERAYEAMPSNGAIQQELCRLYGRRDGVVPPKARLTRGALGRMYTQGGLYLQAEAELKAALADDPDRIDLQTILAQVYWYSDQPAASAQLCGVIVQSLPYSQVANRILREIFRSRGRDADATLYRQRMEALDPYEAMAAPAGDGASLSTAEQVEPEKILVTRLEYVAGMESSGSPDWITSIGARFEEPSGRSGESTPDWLKAPAELDMSDVPGTSGLPDWLAAAQPAGAAAGNGAETASTVPDWLSELSQAGAASAPAAVPDSDLPDWLKRATGPLADDDMPDWMQRLPGSEGEPGLQAFTTQPATPAPVDETMPGWLAAAQKQAAQPDENSAANDWMDTLVGPPSGDVGVAPMVDALQPYQDSDLPDWIKAAAPVPSEGHDDDLPDWLKTSVGAADEAPAQASTPEPSAPLLASAEAAAAGDNLPDWLQAAAAAGPADEVPAWMQTMAEAEPTAMFEAAPPAADAEAPVAATPTDDLPDWLNAAPALAPADVTPAWVQSSTIETLPELEPIAVLEAEPIAAEAEAAMAPTAAEDLPDWLRDAAPDSPADDVPAWMPAPPPDAPVAPETIVYAAEAEAPIWATPPDELPDWLREAKPASPADEVPAWLQAAPEAEPAVEAELPSAEAEPTPLADMPDWLRAVSAASPADEVPAWMQAAPEPEPAVEAELPPAEAEPTPLADMPDWLRAVSAASPADEVPAWMQPGAPKVDAGAPEASIEPVAFDAEALSGPEAHMPGGLADAGEAVPTPAADMPAWLRALTEDTEGRRTAHWESVADEEYGIEEPFDLEEEKIEEPLQPLPEGIPAWLQAVATAAPPPDSEAAQPEAAEEAAPQPAIELPDFLQLASPEAIARASVPFDEVDETDETAQPETVADDEPALAAAELPDWLKAMAPAEPVPTPSAPTFEADVLAAAAAGLNLDEAPDWLKSAQPGAPAEAGLPTGELNMADVPDWLRAAQPGTPTTEGLDLNLDEAPDWLQAAAALTPVEAAAYVTGGEDAAVPDEAETHAWPQTPAGEQPADLPPWAQTEAPGPTDTVVNWLAGKETPEWLRQLRAQAAAQDAAKAQTPAEAGSLEPVEYAAALPEAQAESLEAEAGPAATEPARVEAALLAEEAPVAAVEAVSAMSAEPIAADELNLDEMSPDETMRWLETLAARQGAPAEELIMSGPERALAEAVPVEAVPAERVMLAEPVEKAAPLDAAGGLPDWLREVEASFEVDALADTAPHAAATPAVVPEWLAAEVPVEPELNLETEPEAEVEAQISARTEWLAEGEAVGIGGAEGDATPGLADMRADEALRWLEEKATPAEAAAVPVEGLTEAEGLDDAVPVPGLAEADAPDIETMDADEAMRWLERLAAQQGASGEELLSAPGYWPAEAPAWITDEQPTTDGLTLEPGDAPDWLAELEAAAGAPLEPGILPDWLTAPPAAEPEIAQAVAVAEGPVAAGDDESDFASMDADEAMRWLESLAAQQGANPDELMTTPEERPAEAPAWVVAEQSAAEQEAMMAEPEAVEMVQPSVMEAAAVEPTVAEQRPAKPEAVELALAAAEAGPPQAPDADRLARLSDRLAANRRAKEAEIEARFAQQRAELEAARRLVWESMQAKKAAMEAAPEAQAPVPVAPPPVRSVPPARPAPTERARTGPLTLPRRAPEPTPVLGDDSAWVPATPRTRAPAPVSPYAGQAPETVLATAQAYLKQQDDAAAAAALDHLVGTGEMADNVIAELEGAAYGPSASVPLLRVLGDAYMRSNRLQQALDTYRQALRRL